MELAEVVEMYPGLECLQFPSNDAAGVAALLEKLRERFGKAEIREEDRLRLGSLRAAAQIESEGDGEASLDFLARLEAKVTFETTVADQTRALELVNKTNQFNLNGRRFTEAEWKARVLERPGGFVTTVSYKDKFGPLGRIAVMGGYVEKSACVVDIWVMSCRAFSRQIEFQSLRQLFAKSRAAGIRFAFKPTERNGPLQTFFGHFFEPEALKEGELVLPAELFEKACPPLFQEVLDVG
jgi:FkbH-like protein